MLMEFIAEIIFEIIFECLGEVIDSDKTHCYIKVSIISLCWILICILCLFGLYQTYIRHDFLGISFMVITTAFCIGLWIYSIYKVIKHDRIKTKEVEYYEEK